MSASERLRELERDLADFATVRDAERKLFSSLILIADQTKAAEDVLHEYHLWAEDANDGEFAIWSRDEFMAAFHRLQMAFNALNEALR